MARAKDFLAELIEESTAEDPGFPALYAAEVERRVLLKALVSRLESGEIDPQHSTEDRFAAALGLRVERRLVPAR